MILEGFEIDFNLQIHLRWKHWDTKALHAENVDIENDGLFLEHTNFSTNENSTPDIKKKHI